MYDVVLFLINRLLKLAKKQLTAQKTQTTKVKSHPVHIAFVMKAPIHAEHFRVVFNLRAFRRHFYRAEWKRKSYYLFILFFFRMVAPF